MQKKILALIFLLLSLQVLNSCDKENEKYQIPYVYVNFAVYPNTLDYIAVGQWAYFSGGYKGIIIYRPMPDQFLAFERACPYDPLVDGAIVEVDASGMIAKDKICGSEFILTDGSPVKGPARIGLKQYRTRYDGDVLIVSN